MITQPSAGHVQGLQPDLHPPGLPGRRASTAARSTAPATAASSRSRTARCKAGPATKPLPAEGHQGRRRPDLAWPDRPSTTPGRRARIAAAGEPAVRRGAAPVDSACRRESSVGLRGGLGLPAWLTPRPTVPRRAPSRTRRGSTGSATAPAGSSTSARRRACAAGSTPTSPTPWTLHAAHPADGHHRRRRSTGSRSAPRSRRSSWSTPGSRSTTRGSTSATATTSRTPTWPSPSTRSTRGCR